MIFSRCFLFRSRSVHVGSGVYVDIPQEKKTVHLFEKSSDAKTKVESNADANPLRRLQKEGYVYGQVPSPRTVTQVGDLEVTAERLPIRYEPLSNIMDELPEEFRETIAKIWETAETPSTH